MNQVIIVINHTDFTKDLDFFNKYPWFPYLNCIIGIVIGYLSHILMDAMTDNGVPLLWPLTKKKFSLMKLKTNRDEWIAITIFMFVLLCSVFYKFWDFIKYIILTYL